MRATATRGTLAVVAPAPARSWDALATEIDRLNRSDPGLALERAERWLADEREAGSAEGYARALRAHALRFLGMYEAAVAQYEDAEQRFEALGLHPEAARTRIGHVTALRFLGRYREAVELARQSRLYFLDLGDELQAAKQANNLGTLYRPMGRLTAALRSYREARAVFRRLGERAPLADVEQNIGNVLADLGRYEQALHHLRAAERIRRALGLRTEVAWTLVNVGILSSRRGDYGRALQALTDARAIYDAVGVGRGATEVDLELLPTYVALNLRAESSVAAERAIAGARRHEMPLELGKALLAAGRLAEDSGDPELAYRRTDEARQLFIRTGNRLWEATAQLQHARLTVVGVGGECFPDPQPPTPDPRLRAALRDCQQATALLETAGARDQAAFGRLVEGAILAQLGAPREALDCFRRVLEAGAALGADHLLYRAHAEIGLLYEATAPETAIASYRLAVGHLEAVRARALADDLKLSFLTDKADLYERVVGLLIERGSPDNVAEAYGFVERSKSRTLLEELLAGGQAPRGRQSGVAKLARRVRDLRTRLNRAYTGAYGADEVPSSDNVGRSGQAELVGRLEEEFARATRELQIAARAERRDAGPVAGGGDAAGPIPLPDGGVLVEFYAAGDELVAFVLADGELRLRRLTTLDVAAKLADRFHFQMGKAAFGADYLRANLEASRRSIDTSLQALWDAVLAPLGDDLADREHLVVVPHGPLHSLPFHAFHDGAGYLAERMTVTYAPSAGVYRSCRAAARQLGGRTVVVGVEDAGLPWVAREIEAVAGAWPDATVLTGPRATVRALRRQAGTFDALHLATHAVFRADNPAFSSVKLADAWLTVSDLTELARGAQMVTLSACETGLGGLAVGDEILGLTRGILGAGCPTVVASLWPVSDETTAALMGRFYTSLRSTAAPSSVALGASGPSDALRQAMLDLRAEHDHPYFWAPFVIIGDGQGPTSEPRRGPGPRREVPTNWTNARIEPSETSPRAPIREPHITSEEETE